MRNRRLLLALLTGALLYVATFALRHTRLAQPEVGVRIEGAFTPGGEYPGQPLGLAPAPRTWGSWAGSDANEGTLTIGPFPAPARLRLACSGYPHHAGNDLFLEMPWLGIRLPLETGNVGERWVVKEFEIPFGWQGRQVNLVAVDRSRDLAGWLAVSEPLPPAEGWRIEGGFGADLAAWLCNGLLLGVSFVAAAQWLRGRAWVPTPWLAVAAGGLVALAGYAAFWAYWLHPLAGRIFSAVVLLTAVLAWARAPQRPGSGDEWPAVAKLMVGIGLFYLATLHLFSVPRDFYDLAGNRFVAALPGDNRLPHDVAVLLYHGHSPKHLSPDWLSSDRPPLQSGWLLLTWPATALLGFGATTASGTAAMWLQLLWVAGAYGLLRALGLAPRRACAWTAVLALSGFFLQNTIFTWPKLSAAAWGCAAFALWAWPAAGVAPRARFAAGGVLAALAWLSHGGVAFSFLALAPWVAWRAFRGEWRHWALAAGAFLLLTLPWVAYQKFYDPPGNRLLKWHLAGQVEIDPRGTLAAIRDAYRPLAWWQIASAKLTNLRAQFDGRWRQFADFSAADADARRSDEFYYTARAFTWWLLALIALPFVFIYRHVAPRAPFDGRKHAALAAWIAASLLVWCALMFGRDPAVIILGSYATMLALFVLLSAWLELAHPAGVVLVALLQGGAFMATWAVPNTAIHGPLSYFALGLAFAAAGALVALVLREPRKSDVLADVPGPSACQ